MSKASTARHFGPVPEKRPSGNKLTDDSFRRFKPSNMFEAREKLEYAQEKIQDMEEDLSFGTRFKKGGEKMTDEEYKEWRGKAIGTMRYFKDEAAKMRRFIRADIAHIGAIAGGFDPLSAPSLVEAAYAVFEHLRREKGLDLSALPVEMQKAIHAVSDYAVGTTSTPGAMGDAKKRADAAREAEQQATIDEAKRPRRPRL